MAVLEALFVGRIILPMKFMSILQSRALMLTKEESMLWLDPLMGYLNVPNPNGIAVGWTVLWNNQFGNKQSLTSWAGQYQLAGVVEEIYTFWLLVRELEHAEDWSATNIGQDTFTRNKPTEKMIQKAKKRGKFSHPI